MGWLFVTFIGILRLIKNIKNLKIFFMGNRVILMSMTLSTGHGCSHPGGKGCVYSVDNCDIPKFLIVSSPFVIGLGISMKGGGNDLLFGRLRK